MIVCLQDCCHADSVCSVAVVSDINYSDAGSPLVAVAVAVSVAAVVAVVVVVLVLVLFPANNTAI